MLCLVLLWLCHQVPHRKDLPLWPSIGHHCDTFSADQCIVWGPLRSGGHVNIKMLFHQHRDSYHKDKTVSRPSYLYNRNLHTWKDGIYIGTGPRVLTGFMWLQGPALLQRSDALSRIPAKGSTAFNETAPLPLAKWRHVAVVRQGPVYMILWLLYWHLCMIVPVPIYYCLRASEVILKDMGKFSWFFTIKLNPKNHELCA